MRTKFLAAATTALAVSLAGTAVASTPFGTWSTGQKVDEIPGNSSELNTTATDGCPIESPDGRSLYMASTRPNGHGLLDIWVARRSSPDKPFGPPENLPAPVNSEFDDFCPTPVSGNRLFFVSRRTGEGTCGMGDIYLTRWTPKDGWRPPTHLGCAPAGPNTVLDEQGPSYVRGRLFFSTSAPTVPGDLYMSRQTGHASFGPAAPVAELNSPGNDIQPNVRKDGLEIVFSSNYAHPGAQGLQDVYVATRRSLCDPWSTPVNAGTGVNTGAAESRPSLSRDARRLYFGRTPGEEGDLGLSDIFVSTRERSRHQ